MGRIDGILFAVFCPLVIFRFCLCGEICTRTYMYEGKPDTRNQEDMCAGGCTMMSCIYQKENSIGQQELFWTGCKDAEKQYLIKDWIADTKGEPNCRIMHPQKQNPKRPQACVICDCRKDFCYDQPEGQSNEMRRGWRMLNESFGGPVEGGSGTTLVQGGKKVSSRQVTSNDKPGGGERGGGTTKGKGDANEKDGDQNGNKDRSQSGIDARPGGAAGWTGVGVIMSKLIQH